VSVDVELRMQLQRVQQLLAAQDNDYFKQYGLAPPLFFLLCALTTDDGRRAVDLAGQLALDSSTMSRLLDRAEAAGYIERRADGSDRRVQRIVLSTVGADLIRRIRGSYERTIDRRLRSFSAQDRRQLLDLLQRIDVALHELPPVRRVI
jgi:DNA-binding MarR family transcriptional regulator